MLKRRCFKPKKCYIGVTVLIITVCGLILPVFAGSATNGTEQMSSYEDYFTVEDVAYYAYMDLETASESLKPIILEARNRIIWSKSWVADGIKGRIVGEDGITIEEVPQFSDLFPADWEEPILPIQEVDESQIIHADIIVG